MPSPATPIIELTELTVGSLLYGIYLNLFLTSMYILVKHSRGARARPLRRSTMFVLGCALFVAVTANWIVLIILNFNGFIFFEGGTAAPEYFANTRLGIEAALQGTAIVCIVLNDCMMIYRLWAVWDRKMGVIVLPILTWVGLIGYNRQLGEIISTKIVIFKPIFVFIVITNFYCTGLIVWKIWRITRICVPLNGTNLNVAFVAIVVESSALYTASVLFFAVSQQENSILQYFRSEIGMGKAVEPATSATTTIHFVRGTLTGPNAGEVSHDNVGMKSITP
ncbi:hypothetical protein B0H14DRAFT_2905037 [Mycena olivaceomarginata]|nr:hypothetical protein B0H14DRAFT_2990432 [Mycena olivaceomarginata]KAJ7798823.1 hypothetical protein B0H14DRAFT_2905037 [Mycena olivaceomarginata]